MEFRYIVPMEEKDLSEQIAWFQHGKIKGFANVTNLVAVDQGWEVTYDTKECVTIREFFKKEINEEGLMDVLEVLIRALVNGERQQLDFQKILWSLDQVMIHPFTLEVRFLYSFMVNGEEVKGIREFLLDFIACVHIRTVRYNIQKFLECYFMFEPRMEVTNLLLFIQNMSGHLYGERQYSGQLMLSSRLERDGIKVDELFSIVQPERTGEKETSMLEEQEGRAFLVRERTGEKVLVDLESFRIGKERYSVDYCIKENPAISRTHALIVKKENDFYIRDLNSTNHTYVDDIELIIGEERLLKGKCKLCFANEIFWFMAE